jgi:GNAT superfamily N-acetyltransferase
MTATVVLRAMTEPEYEQFTIRVVGDYARQIVDAGEVLPETAEEQARDETEGLLPDGVGTTNMLLLTAFDDDRPVGSLWLALPSGRRTVAWVFMVLVDAAERGRGYGRAIMLAAEQELASRGIHELGLNVFGHNTVARKLYEDLGYEITAQQMAKRF